MDKKSLSISVVGLGKLGSPIAGCFAAKGYKVIGVDQDARTVEKINKSISPIFEPDLPALFDDLGGRLEATQNCATAISKTDVTFIVVPTPSGSDGTFSNEIVIAACETIGHSLLNKTSFHLVVVISTVMPGSTGGQIQDRLERISGKSCGSDFGLCYAPTFVALGSVVRDFLNPDILLIGESDNYSGQLLEGLYKDICDNNPKAVHMNFVNAEVTKLATNTFVSTKITFGNMLAQICEKLPEAHVDTVTTALGLDSRIGPKYLKGGLGYGGPCLDRDNVALATLANDLGVSARLVEATDLSNGQEVIRLVTLIKSKMKKDSSVGILGLSYKPETNVVEASQGLLLAQMLVAEGIPVCAYDPAAISQAHQVLGESVLFCESAENCIQRSDVVVISTPWNEFRKLNPLAFSPSGSRVLIDCWRILDSSLFSEKTNYIEIGVGPKTNTRI